MKHKLTWIQECKACRGTGLYVGMAEKDGAAVVCHGCKGTGASEQTIEYDDFEGRKFKEGVRWVYQCNPGIGLGNGNGYSFKDFGGMCHEDWEKGHAFPPKSENRQFTCPAWWYQSADCKKKPNWDWCGAAGRFTDCRRFDSKEKCWERWDEEFGMGVGDES